MTTEYLKEFLTLVETGNFTAAAESHFISEATLSRHIKALEDELGVRLFNRLPRRIELTDSGAAFMPYARMILASENSGIESLRTKIDAGKSGLSLGFDPALGAYGIIALLAQFGKMHPDIILNITEAGSFELREQLAEGSIDAAFIFDNKDVRNDKLRYIELCQDILVAVLPCGHPMSKNKNVSLAALKEENILMPPRFTALYEMVSKAFRRSKCEARSRISAGCTRRVLKDFVGNEMCITVLPKQIALELSDGSTAVCDLIPTNVINASLACAGSRSSRTLNLFADYVKEVFDA